MTKTILHIIRDDKFFDGVSDFFDSIPSIKNIYLFYSPKRKFRFNRIKKIDKLTIVHNAKVYHQFFSDPTIDVIYFHALPSSNYHLYKYIDRKKIVIWWSWGFDIYSKYMGLDPLLKVDLYKPITKLYCDYKKIIKEIAKYTIGVFFRSHYVLKRKRMINRVDYCKTVLPIEYTLLQKNAFFRAKPFNYYPFKERPFTFHCSTNNLLLGNSATPTNNHLDVISELKKVGTSLFDKIIIPINYGNRKYADYIKRKITIHNACFLEKRLPFNDYSALMDSCSHAIFGHLREQSIGNIFMCLWKGIKVFLYKDSIAYQQFKINDGFVIYSIEDDLSEKELLTPLSLNDAKYNYNLFLNLLIKTKSEEESILLFEKEFNAIFND